MLLLPPTPLPPPTPFLNTSPFPSLTLHPPPPQQNTAQSTGQWAWVWWGRLRSSVSAWRVGVGGGERVEGWKYYSRSTVNTLPPSVADAHLCRKICRSVDPLHRLTVVVHKMAVVSVKRESDWLAASGQDSQPGDSQLSNVLYETPQRRDITRRLDEGSPPSGGKTEELGGGRAARVCAVCGDRASGSHYRVVSCEGCKGFWRRTVQRDAASSYTCKGGALNCPVTAENRGKCQKCR